MLAYIRSVSAKRRDDEGASAVEYGLLVAAIAAIIILIVFALGGFVKDAFDDTCDAFAENQRENQTVVRTGDESVNSEDCDDAV